MLAAMSASSYTTDRPTRPRCSLGLRIMMARLTSLTAYSGYFMGMSIFSSSSAEAVGISWSRSVICCAACSVMMVDMTHVKSIIITTPLSISSSTRYTPGEVSMRMPTITMAMAPAACADVSPNIMLPDDMGILNTSADA